MYLRSRGVGRNGTGALQRATGERWRDERQACFAVLLGRRGKERREAPSPACNKRNTSAIATSRPLPFLSFLFFRGNVLPFPSLLLLIVLCLLILSQVIDSFAPKNEPNLPSESFVSCCELHPVLFATCLLDASIFCFSCNDIRKCLLSSCSFFICLLNKKHVQMFSETRMLVSLLCFFKISDHCALNLLHGFLQAIFRFSCNIRRHVFCHAVAFCLLRHKTCEKIFCFTMMFCMF